MRCFLNCFGRKRNPTDQQNAALQARSNISVDRNADLGPKITKSLLAYKDKRRWSHKCDYVVSCITMSIGLGNLWRFPYICYENGGGAFLIPYLISVVLLGRPMYYLDLICGQFGGFGAVRMYYNLGMGWGGIGWCQCICCFVVSSYYAFIIALAVLYTFFSLNSSFPWSTCWPEWGSLCVPSRSTRNHSSNLTNLRSSSELFLNVYVLRKAQDIDHGIGMPDLRITGCLAVIWTLCFLIIIYGVKTSGKAAYVTMSVPFIIITTLLIRTLTLPGSLNGIIYMIKPNWGKMLSFKVWREAILQCFYSLAIGYGVMSNYASFNGIHDRIDHVSWLVNCIDPLVSIFNSLVVFAILGFVAHSLGVDVSDVMRGEGMTMAFISYPEAISNFDTVPQLFSVLFFLMILMLGIGSLAATMQVITTNMKELYAFFTDWQVGMMATFCGFLCGIVYTTPGGLACLTIADYYGNVNLLPLLVLLQIIGFLYIYGLRDWCWDVSYMLGGTVNFYWRWTWMIITPIGMLIIYISNYLDTSQFYYNGKYLPVSAFICAYILFIAIHTPLFYYCIKALVYFYDKDLTCREILQKMFLSGNYLPADAEKAEDAREFKARKMQDYKYGDRSHVRQILMCTIHRT